LLANLVIFEVYETTEHALAHLLELREQLIVQKSTNSTRLEDIHIQEASFEWFELRCAAGGGAAYAPAEYLLD